MTASPIEAPAPNAPEAVPIRPAGGWEGAQLRELWTHRELLYFLVWRDVKVRYKQTLIGAAWAILQPVLTMIIFSVVFGRLARIPSDGLPYPVFVYAALVPWTYFATAISSGGSSIVMNDHLVSKVYFPRLLVPLSNVLTPLVDLAIAFSVLVVMMLHYGIVPSMNLVWLPVFLALAVVTALGVALAFSALNVEYRDVRYALPFLVQVWMFASPIVYPASLVPEEWRSLYGLNPMVGVVEGFRWSLLGVGQPPDAGLLAFSGAFAVSLLVAGLVIFKRMERRFADVI